MANDPLRKCPTCLTPVKDADLGLRDYRWVSGSLPGRVAPMDFDAVLERKGRFLVLEMKPKDVRPSGGALYTFKSLVRTGAFDVWLVQGEEGKVKVSPIYADGIGEGMFVDVEELASMVAAWYDSAGREPDGGDDE